MIDYKDINDDQYEMLLKQREYYKTTRQGLIDLCNETTANGDKIIDEMRDCGYKIDVEKGIFKPRYRFFFTELNKKAYEARNILMLSEFQNKIRNAQIRLREIDVEMTEISMQYNAVCYMIDEYERYNKLLSKDKMCKVILDAMDETIEEKKEVAE